MLQIPFEKYINHFNELSKNEKREIIKYYKNLKKKCFKEFLDNVSINLENVFFWDMFFYGLVDFWNKIFKMKKNSRVEYFVKFKTNLVLKFYEICLYKISTISIKNFYFDKSCIELLSYNQDPSPTFTLLLFLITTSQQKRNEIVRFKGLNIRKSIYRHFFRIRNLLISFLKVFDIRNHLYIPLFEYCLPGLDCSVYNRLTLLNFVKLLRLNF